MAKFLKHLGIAKKPPPTPPTIDYEQSLHSNSSTVGVKCTKFENGQSTPALLQEYTDPLDFHPGAEFDGENFYTSPTEEDVYSEPYENARFLSAVVVQQRESRVTQVAEDFYDEVPTVDYQSEPNEELAAGDETVEPDGLVAIEYDEPWEWGASPSVESLTHPSGAHPSRLSKGSPVSSSGSSRCTGYPTLDYDGGSSGNLLDSESSLSFEFREDNDMPIRHLYETAFDSKVKREVDDIDRLSQSPVLRGESSSSTSSPGSGGRVRVKTLYNSNELAGGGGGGAKISGSNGHQHRASSRMRKSNGERISRSRTTDGIISVTDDKPPSLPSLDLPDSRLPSSNSRIIPNFNQLKTETRRRVTLFPDHSLPPKASDKGASPLRRPAPIKIKAVIEIAPKSIRSSRSSSSNSSLEDNRNLALESFTCSSSKSMSSLKPSALFNGNATKELIALAGDLGKERKNQFERTPRAVTANNCSNRLTLSDNNNANAIVGALNTVGFSAKSNSVGTNVLSVSNSVPARNDICPNCCQPIVANSTTRSKSLADVQFESFSRGQTLPGKSKDSATSQNALLCKCSAVQSPENDIRPLAEYDLPWDVPKRFAPVVVGPLTGPRSFASSTVPENENEKDVDPRDELKVDTDEETATSEEKENNPRRSFELKLPPPKDFNCLDFESNSAPAELDKMGEETERDDNVVTILKSPSETRITSNDPIFESAKITLPTCSATRKILNLNFNTTNAPSDKNLRHGLALNFGFCSLSARGESVDPVVPLEEQGWYHGSISRIDAENSLRLLKEGSYLVRNSESSKKDYSLSLKSARGFMHMKIVNNEGNYILGQFSKPFSSIPEMIHHYSNNKLPIRGAEHMSLLYPVIAQLL